MDLSWPIRIFATTGVVELSPANAWKVDYSIRSLAGNDLSSIVGGGGRFELG